MAGTVHADFGDRLVIGCQAGVDARLAALEAASLAGKPLQVHGVERVGDLRWWSSLADGYGMRVRWELPATGGSAFAFVHASDRSAVTS